MSINKLRKYIMIVRVHFEVHGKLEARIVILVAIIATLPRFFWILFYCFHVYSCLMALASNNQHVWLFFVLPVA